MEYSLTQHARERYAERIMGKIDKMEVQKFIAEHEDKIYEDIEKMIEYGEVIYEGQQVRTKDIRPASYILRNDWLVVVNPQNKTVVTLYKIDLGAGAEINQMYISTMRDKLESAKKEVAEKVEALKIITDSYADGIKENEEMIKDYKAKIKSLEEQNECLNRLIREETTNIAIAEENIRDIISIMTTGTKF